MPAGDAIDPGRARRPRFSKRDASSWLARAAGFIDAFTNSRAGALTRRQAARCSISERRDGIRGSTSPTRASRRRRRTAAPLDDAVDDAADRDQGRQGGAVPIGHRRRRDGRSSASAWTAKDLIELTPEGEQLSHDPFLIPDGAPDKLFFSARKMSQIALDDLRRLDRQGRARPGDLHRGSARVPERRRGGRQDGARAPVPVALGELPAPARRRLGQGRAAVPAPRAEALDLQRGVLARRQARLRRHRPRLGAGGDPRARREDRQGAGAALDRAGERAALRLAVARRGGLLAVTLVVGNHSRDPAARRQEARAGGQGRDAARAGLRQRLLRGRRARARAVVDPERAGRGVRDRRAHREGRAAPPGGARRRSRACRRSRSRPSTSRRSGGGKIPANVYLPQGDAGQAAPGAVSSITAARRACR